MIRLVIVLLLSFIALAARGEQHLDAYRVETLVANQSEAERIAAIKTGLGDVILQVTGDPTSLQHPVVRQAISTAAADYLLQFSYSVDRDKNDNEGVKLTLNYSYQAIQLLLRQAQVPLWSSNSAKDSQTLMMRIDQVKNFTDFKQVRSYLDTITMIRRSELLSVSKDILVFRLTLDGDLALLKSALESDKKLQIEELMVDTSSAQGNQLTFHWQN